MIFSNPQAWFFATISGMKRIWAPWRMKFVESVPKDCVFCGIHARLNDQDDLVVWRGATALVVLNRFPYTSGHLLVVASQHKPSFEDLNPDCRSEMMELATQAMTILRRLYKPDGFNLGANIGEAAGAGIPGHIHLHVVPRWMGDANFMLSLADTKVMPEALEASYARIRAAWIGKE
jgi:ATP adenylyltransferase